MKVAIAFTKCKVKDCPSKKRSRTGYCARHAEQIRRVGYIFGSPDRSKNTPNDFVLEGNICKIRMFDKHGFFTKEAIVDRDCYDLVKDDKWHCQKDDYVYGSKKIGYGLHHIILGVVPSYKIRIDHRNRNPLDNRRHNLRVCSSQQNNYNSKGHSNTGLKGISINKNGNYSVFVCGKYLGSFLNRERAIGVYNKEAKRVQKEFAFINSSK